MIPFTIELQNQYGGVLQKVLFIRRLFNISLVFMILGVCLWCSVFLVSNVPFSSSDETLVQKFVLNTWKNFLNNHGFYDRPLLNELFYWNNRIFCVRTFLLLYSTTEF